MSDSITCPNCHTEIPLTEAISHEVEERLRIEFDEARRKVESEHAEALALKDAEHQSQVAGARADVMAAAEARASEKVATELGDLSARLEEQVSLRRDAETRELALRKEKRALQAEREALELEVERKLDEERTQIVSSTTERVEEAYRMKLREKDLTLEQMGKRIDALQAAADQKRSGLQGEVLEREIEDVLKESFPADGITPVKTGKRGADVLQRVRSPRGLDCGALLWESKNAKHWNSAWVAKLRSDQQAERADVAIIVTPALPEGVNRMAFHDGVWICDFASATTLATALRHSLVEITQARVIDSNRSQALDEVYEYLCGREFQHRVTNTVAAALVMKEDLDAERRASERSLAKREKQIDMLLRNSAGMYGELQAIVGGALQPVAALELPPGASDGEEPLALAS
jgi:hypothetical protein